MSGSETREQMIEDAARALIGEVERTLGPDFMDGPLLGKRQFQRIIDAINTPPAPASDVATRLATGCEVAASEALVLWRASGVLEKTHATVISEATRRGVAAAQADTMAPSRTDLGGGSAA